jgi:hypothetical protein
MCVFGLAAERIDFGRIEFDRIDFGWKWVEQNWFLFGYVIVKVILNIWCCLDNWIKITFKGVNYQKDPNIYLKKN